MSYVDVLIVEERINHGLCFGKQYYYFGKHLGPFGKLRYFVAEANQTRDIWVSINHSYTGQVTPCTCLAYDIVCVQI